jgi:hypothetical protein
MSLFNDASLIVTPNGYKEGKIYSLKPFNGSGDLTVVRNTTATRVNSNGLIETVGLNVPRIDYSNGSCPSILVEPQRTNFALRSEEFNDASWLLIGATTSSNVAISPSGTTNADELIGDGTSTVVRIRRSASLSAGVHTFSCFLKSGTDNFAFLEFSGFLDISGTSTAFFDLANGTTPTSGASIENYGNGWYRCYISATISLLDTSGTVGFRVVPNISANSFPTVGDANGKSILAWGAQLEAGAYPTSYIPTTSASVTRNVDVIRKTDISSLIGQTEGTIFVGIYDYNFTPNNASPYFEIYADANNRIIILKNTSNQYQLVVRNGGVTQLSIATASISGNSKIAIAYKENDCVVYVNGVQVGIDTSVTIPTCSAVYLGASIVGVFVQKDVFNVAALWKERFTNAQLAQLTTI